MFKNLKKNLNAEANEIFYKVLQHVRRMTIVKFSKQNDNENLYMFQLSEMFKYKFICISN